MILRAGQKSPFQARYRVQAKLGIGFQCQKTDVTQSTISMPGGLGVYDLPTRTRRPQRNSTNYLQCDMRPYQENGAPVLREDTDALGSSAS